MTTKEGIKKVREDFETELRSTEKKFETFVNGIGAWLGVITEKRGLQKRCSRTAK
ncbi:MAG: hypothetical protein OWQ54_10250 [Sulfolobaceae archaeon]|nr:hypothetical protein [Sulfolobaceae archaeon]